MINQLIKKTLNQSRQIQTPKFLKKNQIKLTPDQLQAVKQSLEKNFYQGWRRPDRYSPKMYAADLQAHLLQRLEYDRILYIPWLNKTQKLKGAKILEIGCGTGSSTIALAEQGAEVTAIDIDAGALQVARDRCKIYNLPAEIIHGNAVELWPKFKQQNFDLIIFFACMEHMTYEERIAGLKQYFGWLRAGAYLSIVETPNRLWYFDSHTSNLPFFNWLPDQAAFDYAKFSARGNFKELYDQPSTENFLHFLRQGRGFSFHELAIALNRPADKLTIASYIKRQFLPFSLDKKFHRILTQIYPAVSPGFFYPMIDLMIKK